jgi:hypothetical protein
MVAYTRGDRVAGDRHRSEFEALRGGGMRTGMALILARAGRTDEAMAWLQQAVEQRETPVCWLKTAGEYQPLRQHPGWPALLRAVGLAEESVHE